MRILLTIILSVLSLMASGTVYYVKTGGNDASAGTSDALAWASIAKVNSFWAAGSFAPGDQIFFRRGDTFYGTITVSESGTSGFPITIGAYGTGNRPVITGFTEITGWGSEGGGVYSKVVSVPEILNMVTVNGAVKPLGRYPDSGWLTIDSHTGNTSVTVSELNSSTTNWTGAQVVIRKNSWIIDRNEITAHSGSALTYTGSTDYDAVNGYGMFIQNDRRTLTASYEWYYDWYKVYMYFGAESPTAKAVKVATLSNLISLSSRQYITIDNLKLSGSNVGLLRLVGTSNVIVQNCDFDYAGWDAIFLDGTTNDLRVANCTFNRTHNQVLSGAYLSVQNRTYFGYNVVKNTGLYPGMSSDWDNGAVAINESGSSFTIYEYNSIDTTGYIPIRFTGSGSIVRNNVINYFCFVKDDGAGIYTFAGPDSISYNTQRVIENNIVLNGAEAPGGLAATNPVKLTAGIYGDENASHILIRNNTVAFCPTGLMFNGAHRITARGNTLHGMGYVNIHIDVHLDQPIYLMRLVRNIISRTGGVVLTENTQAGRLGLTRGISRISYAQGYYSFGVADSNYYCGPDDASYFWANRTLYNGFYQLNFTQWKALTSKEVNSTIQPTTDRFEYNATNLPKTVDLGQYIYRDVFNNSYSTSVELLPYTSKVLFVTGILPPQTPVSLTWDARNDNTGVSVDGLAVPHSSPTSFVYRRSYLTGSALSGYVLDAGDESTEGGANNLDNMVIEGNKIVWGGVQDYSRITHGVFMGNQRNFHLKYNYIENCPLGAIAKSSFNQTFTQGGVYYNIIKGGLVAVNIKGMAGVQVYNNTLYADLNITNWRGLVMVYPNTDASGNNSQATGVKIKNNIFYTKYPTLMINIANDMTTAVAQAQMVGMEIDYNIYWCETGNASDIKFKVGSTVYTWAQWRTAYPQFDQHSVILNPNFGDFVAFTPQARLDYGVDLGASFNTGLSTSATWAVGSYPALTIQNGTWQVGAKVYAAAPVTGNYYIHPNGSDASAGTILAPFRTIQKAYSVASAGSIIWIRGGTYNETQPIYLTGKSGTLNNHIKFWAYPGERPVFRKAVGAAFTNYGWPRALFRITGAHYLHFKGFDIAYNTQEDGQMYPGISNYNANNNIYEFLDIHHNGIGIRCEGTSNGNLFKNCDVHHNADPLTASGAYGDGDGINIDNITSTAVNNNVTGCRLYYNSDDGLDFWKNEGTSTVDSCWAWKNGYLENGSASSGDGHGFKMGAQLIDQGATTERFIVKHCVSFENKYAGFHQNGALSAVTLYNNISYNNHRDAGFWFNSGVFRHKLYNNIAFEAYVPAAVLYSGSYVGSNTFTISGAANPSYSLSATDFLSVTDGLTKLSSARQSNGNLPHIDFLHLASTSEFVDGGQNVGLPYFGEAPDLGPFETGAISSTIPTVVIINPTYTTGPTTVTVYGNANDQGGAAITAKGVCWATYQNPSIPASSWTNVGSGLGPFSVNIGDLSPGYTYYLRAFASNALGTGYSPQVSITMPEDIEYGGTNIVTHIADLLKFGTELISPPDVFVSTDVDGDGFHVDTDCNDNNVSIYPGAPEICGNGIDEDCNGGDLACPPPASDIDNDGYSVADGDCNDNNANVYPGRPEICGDGIDQDCNGSDLACPTPTGDIYMSPTGNDGNPGTLASPYRTLGKCLSVASAGKTIYVRGGTYNISFSTQTYLTISQDGTSGSWINIWAYPGDPKVIFDFGGASYAGTRFGFRVSGANYLHFKGIHVTNLREYSWTTYGVPWETINSSNIKYENCSVSWSAAGWTCEQTCNYITYLNCDVYAVDDKVDGGGYANGFSANINPGGRITYTNCRAWDTSDDGFDFFGSAGYITVEGSWAFDNGTGRFGNGNGVGIKMGANPDPVESGVQRIIRKCLVWNNTLSAFDESVDGRTEMTHQVFNNTSYNNLELHGYRTAAPPTRYIQNNISYLDDYIYSFGSGNVISNNSWQISSVSAADFITTNPSGTDGPRKADGSLPDTNFMRLAAGSDMINAGANVGLSFSGSAPDLGCWERE